MTLASSLRVLVFMSVTWWSLLLLPIFLVLPSYAAPTCPTTTEAGPAPTADSGDPISFNLYCEDTSHRTMRYAPVMGLTAYYPSGAVSSSAQFQPICAPQDSLGGTGYGTDQYTDTESTRDTLVFSHALHHLRVNTHPENQAVVGIRNPHHKGTPRHIGAQFSDGNKAITLCCPRHQHITGIAGVFYTGGSNSAPYYSQFSIRCSQSDVCVSGDTEVRVAGGNCSSSSNGLLEALSANCPSSLRRMSELQIGDYVLSDDFGSKRSTPARVEYISKSVAHEEMTLYGVNGGVGFFTAQHELMTADGGCAMVDAAGWLARTADFACKPVELTIGTTLLMEAANGELQAVAVSSVERHNVSVGSLLYNAYLSSGWSMRGNGILLSEPSRRHMRDWYTNPARHAAALSMQERSRLYKDMMATAAKEDVGGNANLYTLQDQLWQSHATQVERRVQRLPADGSSRSDAVRELLTSLKSAADSWSTSRLLAASRPSASRSSISSSRQQDDDEYLHFITTGELLEHGAPKVWRDGVLYPTMYDVLFKLVGHVRDELTAISDAAIVQDLILRIQVRLDSWVSNGENNIRAGVASGDS